MTVSSTPTATASATPTSSRTQRPSSTPTASPSPAPAPEPGANITFFGLAAADDVPLQPIGTDANGRPVFERRFGQGFSLVLEARPGSNRQRVGGSAFNYDPTDPFVRPDLQVLLSRPLGNGSPAVCDNSSPNFGGIPAVEPPYFSEAQVISDAINDLGCRFVDGTGNPSGRSDSDACTMFPDATFHFVDALSTIQFCARIAAAFRFPEGDTVVTARVRDAGGQFGPVRQMVVRINPTASGSPTLTHVPTATATPSYTPTPVPSPGPPGEITFFGIAGADSAPLEPTGEDSEGRPLFERRFGRGFYLVIEAKPLGGLRHVGRSAFNYDPTDPAVRPDLQVLLSRPLGDGSTAVCDNGEPTFGGVPGTDSPDFRETQAVSDAINDFGCRVDDGTGNPSGRSDSDACTMFPDATFHFVAEDSDVQFCAFIASSFGFPPGDTVVSARLREGQVRQIVIRVTG
ncbi:MAG: hypothetical protein HY699_06935 [Deltaproteobacteria bacterium]|nr:hypothetical protein [Deltaproteobacteria bacterium]